MLQPNAHTGQVLVPAQPAAHLTPTRLREIESALPARASVPLTVLVEKARMTVVDLPPDGGENGFPAGSVASWRSAAPI